MYVVVIGGGKVGSHLAKVLAHEGKHVALVEVNPEKCALLEEALPGVTLICGDGDEPYVLDEASARNADAIVAVTGHDEDNLVVCLLGKLEYNVPLTVARINNPANEWLFTEAFGVDIPVSNTTMIVAALEECVGQACVREG